MSNQTKQWIGGGLFLILLLAIIPWVIGWKTQSVTDSTVRGLDGPLLSESQQRELGLSDSQKEKIRALEKEYRARLGRLCGQHCAARMEISTELQHGTVDAKRVFQLGQEAGNAYSEAERATIEQMMKVSAVLDPHQRELFLKRVGEHIRATCPREFLQ